MSNKEMTKEDVIKSIEAFSISAEFLLCAVRALASGASPNGMDVMDPVKWAQAKLNEGMTLLKPSD